LIVEDDGPIREALTEAFESEGWSVRGASNGKEALEVIERSDVGVLVLDLMMPIMSGWELLERLRKSATHAELPVLVMTAVAHVPRAPRGPLFIKPLNIESLVRAIRSQLSRR
jgi:DNA-binding response OmpR family regulator